MKRNEIDELKTLGFVGFITVKELCSNISLIPKIKGVYCILLCEPQHCNFVEIGCGGHFKNKNPNVSINELQANWVESTNIVYIGKAGGNGKIATLRSRLKQYLQFGQGQKVGHWGGRYIWQLQDSPSLMICWKELIIEEPREYENNLIKLFAAKHGKRPFANLTD